jgi:lipopolysaccharide exporter
LQRGNLETAFTLKVILGTGAFGAALLVAPFAWHFCDHPAAANVTRFLALNFFISTIGFLPLIQLTREMNYRALVIPGVINAVVRAALAITLVLAGWKFWALVVADVGANLAGGLAMQFVRKTPLGFRFDRADAMEFLRFGLPLLGTGLLAFVILNLANFLISSTMGIAQLGYYTLAFTWGTFVWGLLDTVNTVLFPAFAAIQHEGEKLRRWYLKTLDLVAFVAVVVNTALLANAHSFLVIFLGKGSDKWIPAAATFQILCGYGILCAITAPIGNCLMARGLTRIMLQACFLAGVIQMVLLSLALQTLKIEWIAVAVMLAYVTQAFIYVPALRREFSITLAELVRQLWPMMPAMAAGWWATHVLFRSAEGSLFALAYRGLFTVSVTALVHGICTGFRCFQEAWELTFQRFLTRSPTAMREKRETYFDE